jgi:glycosyltransferase involved in cell wall biosynthesis
MKKIVILSLGRLGAGPVYTYEMASALSKQAELLVILSTYVENKDIWDKAVKDNQKLQVKYVKTYQSEISFVLSFFNIFRFVRIVKMINSYDPDIVYSPMAHLWDPVIFPFIKCKMKLKTIHDVELHKGENSIIARLFHFFSFKQADKYIILSQKYEQNLVDKGIDKQDIVIIPHACFSSYTDDSETTDSEFHNKILFFGRIIKYKGLDVLLQAMEIIVKSMPAIKLIIAGDGDISIYKKEMEVLHDNIELYNDWIPIEDVKIYMKKADILILPYIHASQSGVIPLAYSFSKPVIASDIGAISEQIQENETGFLVEPNNPVKLADAILKLMSSPALIFEMSQKCKQVYLSELTWDASAQKIMGVLGANCISKTSTE